MPMLRDHRQRPAGVRPLHAHAARRLRAVPAPGARARRRPGAARARRSSTSRCSRPFGLPARLPADHDAPRRRAERSVTTTLPASVELLERALDYTRGAAGRRPRRPARPARRRAPGGGSATCSCTWRTRSTRSPRRPAAQVAVHLTHTTAGRIAAIEEKACALLGAWSRPGPGRRRWWAGSTWPARSWSRPRRSRSPSTAGTSARPPTPRPSPPTWRRPAAGRAPRRSTPADRGVRFAPRRPGRRRTRPTTSDCWPFSGAPDWSSAKFPAFPLAGGAAGSYARHHAVPPGQLRGRGREDWSRSSTRRSCWSRALQRARRRDRRRPRLPDPGGRARRTRSTSSSASRCSPPRSTAGSPAASWARPAPSANASARSWTGPGSSARPPTTAAASCAPRSTTSSSPRATSPGSPACSTPASDVPDLIPWRTAAALAAVRLGHRVEGTALAREHLALAGTAGAPYPIALGLRTLATVDAHTDRVVAAARRPSTSSTACRPRGSGRRSRPTSPACCCSAAAPATRAEGAGAAARRRDVRRQREPLAAAGPGPPAAGPDGRGPAAGARRDARRR